MTESPTPVSGNAMELVERLRSKARHKREVAATRDGQRRDYLRSEAVMFDAAADEIERLLSQGGAPEGPSRTEQVLEDARTAIKIYDGVLALKARVATEFARGVDAAVKIIDGKVADYTSEHGSLDPETGVMEFSRSGEEYVSTLEELAEEIRTSLATGAVQPPEGGTGWRTPDNLPELNDGDRFAVYLAFDTGEVKLADWVAWTETASEYHASTGVYLGQSPQDGDALYMTDDGFDVRKGDDGRWVSHEHHDDGTKTPFYVTAWTEALKPLPSPPGQDDRTDACPETDGSLNQSALPRKDVEGQLSVSDYERGRLEGRTTVDIMYANRIAELEAALSAERASVIEECAKVADGIAAEARMRRDDAGDDDDAVSVHESHRVTASYVAAAIRDLGKQTGGADA